MLKSSHAQLLQSGRIFPGKLHSPTSRELVLHLQTGPKALALELAVKGCLASVELMVRTQVETAVVQALRGCQVPTEGKERGL